MTPVVCLTKSPALVNRFALSKTVAPPIGLAYLAGALQANGFKSQIVDAVGENPDKLCELDFTKAYSIGLPREEIVSLMDERADIVGVSCMFSSSWPYDHRLIRLIRERFPRARIVLGGEHATACADYILETCPDVDICVRGEGEQTFLQLVGALRDGGDLSKVPGIVYRKPEGIQHTQAPTRIADINAIPLPAWDKVPLENYMKRGLGHGVSNARNMPLMATRGCPYQCTFCSSPQMWTTKWMARDPHLVVDEIALYIQKYKAENFDLYDLTAIIKKEWVVAFANEIMARDIHITYQLPSGTRSEAIDEEVANLLYESGCRHMNYAPETGSPDTLKRIKKKVRLPNLEKSLRGACRRGLRVMCNTILFPDDTIWDVLATFRFMLRCSWLGLHDITFVSYVPYPGAELYEQLVKEKRILPMSEEYFVSLLTHSDLSSVNSYNPHFSGRQVQLIRFLFLAVFYLSSYLFRPHRLLLSAMNLLRGKPGSRGEDSLRSFLQRQIWISQRSVKVPAQSRTT